jgi:hypothetical protein
VLPLYRPEQLLNVEGLLYLHRSYFAQALRDSPKHPLGHRYSPSVLAAYRNARRLISSLRSLYAVHSKLTSTTWRVYVLSPMQLFADSFFHRPFWTGIFTSCYILGGIVIETPSCSLAQPALQELERTIPFYNQGSQACNTLATAVYFLVPSFFFLSC